MISAVTALMLGASGADWRRTKAIRIRHLPCSADPCQDVIGDMPGGTQDARKVREFVDLDDRQTVRGLDGVDSVDFEAEDVAAAQGQIDHVGVELDLPRQCRGVAVERRRFAHGEDFPATDVEFQVEAIIGQVVLGEDQFIGPVDVP